MKQPTFTCIGNACIDIVASVPEDFLERHNISKSFCTHLGSVEVLNILKSELDSYQIIPGGAGANTAHALSALGAQVNFISCRADDEEGHIFEKNMMENGVVPHIARPENSRRDLTPQVICLSTPDSDRTFASYDGISNYFGIEHIPDEIIRSSTLLYLDGYTLCSETITDAYLTKMNLLHASGGRACLNVGDRSLIEMNPDKISALLEKCDGYICNKAEARAIYGEEKSAKDLAGIMRDKFSFGAVTDSANGAYIFNNGEMAHIPAMDISHITISDSVGAGDHFSAGLLYGLQHGLSLEQSGKLATLCAVDCLSHPGGRPLGGKDSLKHLVEKIKT